MLSLVDCLGLCELTEDEIAAIGEHEHVPDIIAAELGAYLMRTGAGAAVVTQMIADDIADATRRGDFGHAAKLKMTLKHFCETHPDAATLG